MEARKLTVETIEGVDGPATVRVHLAGQWHISDGLAPVSAIDSALQRGKVERVVFDCEGLSAWDSSLVVFVERTFTLCKLYQVTVEREGLPEGLQRLLALTELRDGQEPPPAPKRENALARLGLRGIAVGRAIHDMLRFLGEATIAFFRMLVGRARYRRGDLLGEVEIAGVRGLPIITVVSFLLGMILAFVAGITLRPFGTQIYVADVVTVSMVRELGPVMTAIVMAGRTGSSYAAQLGTMQVTQEIDALTTLGIPPMEFLVLPRMLALSLMLPLLCVYSDFIAMLGGAVVSVGTDMSGIQYLQQCRGAIKLSTFWIGMSKAAVFGVVVAICGCLQGLRAGKSAAAVGQAATSAVVTSIVWVIALDGLFAVLLNVLGDLMDIAVDNLTLSFGDFVVMKDLSFEVPRGSIFFIVGASGSGKSTVLRAMLGLHQPASGAIRYDGADFVGMTLEERELLLRRFGVLFQSSGLFTSMTVGENVGLPLGEYTGLAPPEIDEVAAVKLSLVGLSGFADFYPTQLSGGMQKRAGLARAMALDPDVLFLDEPSAGLDPVNTRRLDRLIVELRDSLSATVVIVSHELSSILSIGDQCVFLDAAERTISAQGPPRELAEHPPNERVAEFFNG